MECLFTLFYSHINYAYNKNLSRSQARWDTTMAAVSLCSDYSRYVCTLYLWCYVLKRIFKVKRVLLLLMSSICFSCATVKTIYPVNNHVQIEHRGKESYCSEIPRIYSGLMYNFCLFYGEPSKVINLGSRFGSVPFFVIDTAFSVAADTIVIPYTAVQQANKGNIKVN